MMNDVMKPKLSTASRGSKCVVARTDDNRTRDRTQIIWPEWSDADVNSEKWDLPKVTGKTKSKRSQKSGSSAATTTVSTVVGNTGQFEDPYPVSLPWSLRTECTWSRPSVLYPSLKLVMHSTSTMYPDLVSSNRHILGSAFMRSFITAVYSLMYLGYTHPFVVEWQTSNFVANTSGAAWKPWHHVYSLCRAGKGQNHQPQVNSLGKYIVRLYWMGCWRKILVDDKYPVDSIGRVLLPTITNTNTNEFELWPCLLTKALLKIASLTWTETNDIVDFDIISCLTGWIEQKICTDGMTTLEIWNVCSGYSDHFTWPEEITDKRDKKSKKNKSKRSSSKSSSKKGSKKSTKTDKSSKTLKNSKTSKSTKSKKSSKSAKSSKSKAPSDSCSFYLFASCVDLKTVDENIVDDLTPCWEHDFLIDQTRDIPLVKRVPELVVLPWKVYRWIDWAVEHGLWERDELIKNIKCFKVVSNLRKINDEHIFDVTKSEQEHIIRMSVEIAQKLIDKKKKKKKDKSRKKSKEKKKDKGSGSKERKEKKKGKKSKSSKSSGKKKKAEVEFIDPSVWCNFNKMSPYIERVTIYFKPSAFLTNIVVSDIQLHGTSDIKQRHSAKKVKDKTKESIKYLHWKNELMISRNEPIYLFMDSIDFKLTVFSLAHVGNDFPKPIIIKQSAAEIIDKSMCRKLVCKLGKCINECVCQKKSDITVGEVEKFTDTRTTAYLMIEDFDWTKIRIGEFNYFLNTFGTKSLMLDLEKGRHVKRLWLNSDESYVLRILCDTEIKIGRIEDILDGMSLESELVTKYCYDICSAFGYLVKGFGTPDYGMSLRKFYESYKPIVNLSKKQMSKVHDGFMDEFIKILADNNPTDQHYKLLRALRVLFLNPNLRIKQKGALDSKQSLILEKSDSNIECECEDKDGLNLRINSAIKIQAFLKMIYMRKLKALHNPYHKEFQQILESLKRMYNSAMSGKVRNICFDLIRNIIRNEQLQVIVHYFPFYRDLNTVVLLKQFNGNIKQIKAHSWVPITRQVFFTNVSTAGVFVRVYIFCALPEYVLRIFNNDTNKEIDRYTNNALVCKYDKNEHGYTVLCYGWTNDRPMDNLNWTLSIIAEKLSNNPSIVVNFVEIQNSQVRGNYIPNLNNLVTSCAVKFQDLSPATFRFSVSSENVNIKLKCIDKHGTVLNESTGIQNVLLPVVIPRKTEILESELDSSHDMRKLSHFKKLLKRRRFSKTSSKNNSERNSIFSISSMKRRSKEMVSRDNNTIEYFIQAFVMDNSWPLIASEWALVEYLKTRNYIEDELLQKPQKNKKIKDTENEKPFWILTTITDSGKLIKTSVDQRRTEKIKEIKRHCFASNTTRFLYGLELRQEFLEKNYIKWTRASTEKLTESSINSQSILSTEHNESRPISRELLAKSKSLIEYKSTLSHINFCLKCNKILTAENALFSTSPKSIDHMLPPFDLNNYDKEMDRFRLVISPEQEEKIFTDINVALENFENEQNLFTAHKNEYLEYMRQRNIFLKQWYEDIKNDSLFMINEIEILKENYIKKLREEKRLQKGKPIKDKKGRKKKKK